MNARRAALGLAAILAVGCSSADFEAGHEHPVRPPAPPSSDEEAPTLGPWTCVAQWTSNVLWKKFLKARNECWCNTVKPVKTETDVRTVQAFDPNSANVAWWIEWAKEPGPRHVVWGPQCTRLPP